MADGDGDGAVASSTSSTTPRSKAAENQARWRAKQAADVHALRAAFAGAEARERQLAAERDSALLRLGDLQRMYVGVVRENESYRRLVYGHAHGVRNSTPRTPAVIALELERSRADVAERERDKLREQVQTISGDLCSARHALTVACGQRDAQHALAVAANEARIAALAERNAAACTSASSTRRASSASTLTAVSTRTVVPSPIMVFGAAPAVSEGGIFFLTLSRLLRVFRVLSRRFGIQAPPTAREICREPNSRQVLAAALDVAVSSRLLASRRSTVSVVHNVVAFAVVAMQRRQAGDDAGTSDSGDEVRKRCVSSLLTWYMVRCRLRKVPR
jgi:hypothetical protein